MNFGDIAQWAAVLLLAIGYMVTVVRNGKGKERSYGAFEQSMKQSIKDIKEDLSHKDYGLSALSKSINGIKTNCAGVTAGFTERLSANDKDIREVKGSCLNRRKTDKCE